MRLDTEASTAALRQIKKRFGVSQAALLRATLRREVTLIERNSFLYVFRATQVEQFPCLHSLANACNPFAPAPIVPAPPACGRATDADELA